MSSLFADELLLRQAAQQMACQMAAALPEAEESPSSGFEREMAEVMARVRRRRGARTVWRHAAAAAVTVLLSFGVVLAASPEARAAVGQWVRKATTAVTAYWFPPSRSAGTWTGGGPAWLPEGCAAAQDMTEENGVRVIRYTSLRGDILLESIPLSGEGEVSFEIRSYQTDGISDSVTGERPQGEPGDPEGYAVTEVQVCGRQAQFYAFRDPPGGSRYGGSAFAVRFYLDGAYTHHVALAAHSRLLVWVDEDAGQIFLLLGRIGQDDALRMAESMYGT